MKKMIKTTFPILLLGLTTTVNAQWQQCIGSENLDVQALHVTGNFDFFGGASGTYRSLDQSTSYSFSNSGNDSVGPTRGIISDGNHIYTCTSQGVFRSDDNGQNWISKSNGLTQLLCHGIISTNSGIFLSTLSGVFKTTIPLRVASVTLILSIPTPARPITRKFLAEAIAFALIRVPLLIIQASASFAALFFCSSEK